MGMAAPIYYTAEEVVFRLAMSLSEYVRQRRVGHLFCSPADISWGPDTLVQPDVFVVPLEQARTLDWAAMTNLLLVAEVLSPSSRRADRFTKRAEYQRRGVPLYWIVDPDERQVEVWTPPDSFPHFERERLRWQPGGPGVPFELELSQLFKPL